MRKRINSAASLMMVLAIVATFAMPIAQAQAYYTVTVKAEDLAATSLAVSVAWVNASAISGSGTTAFSIPFTIGALTLTAPATHIASSVFYIFDHWTGGSTNRQQIFNITTDMTVTAYYQKVLSVSKQLTDSFYLESGIKVPVNPSQVPLGKLVYFNMTITFHVDAAFSGVKVTDGIGADLVLDKLIASSGTPTYEKASTKGKMSATKVTWTIGDTVAGMDYTLDIRVHTGLNPQQKQEYTSTGKHSLNGGPEIHLNYNTAEYVIQGPPVEITVV
jgi:hypothetical protein